jgi:hypothetical protein
MSLAPDGDLLGKPTIRQEPKMPVNHVLAAIAVADVPAALGWYERLLGRPADALPMDGLAEWRFPQGGVIQLVEDADRAGRSLLTLEVDDLRQELISLRERGLDPGGLDDTTSDKVLFATVTDAGGNTITLVEQR